MAVVTPITSAGHRARVTLYLPHEDLAELQEFARVADRSVAAEIRLAIRARIEQLAKTAA